jgi:hypothetical protein
MSKSEKNAYFSHAFAINFYVEIFQNFFNRFEISVKLLRFLMPYIEFLKKKKNFLLFSKLLMQMRMKRLKKGKPF